MTPLGCPDCLLIRYEPRALRARLRASMNARARVRHSRARVSRPSLCRSIFFPSLFVEGALFSACLRVCAISLFCLFLFLRRIRDVGCCLSIHTAERGNRENSWVSRDARQTAAMKSLMLLRFRSNITCFSPVPLYSVCPRNKAPYAAAAVSSLTSAGLLWRSFKLVSNRRVSRAIIHRNLAGSGDRSDLTALHCVIVALRGIENPIPRFLPLSLHSPSLSSFLFSLYGLPLQSS